MNNSTIFSEVTLPDWVYVEQVAFSGIIALIGIPGNILIILVFLISQEKTTTDYMVFSMAISDFLGSTICTTLNLLRNIPALWANIGSEWFCRGYSFFTVCTGFFSSMILGAVAVDRYMKTCRPFSDVLPIPRTKLLCVAICIFVPLCVIPSFGIERFDYSTGACFTTGNELVWSIILYFITFLCCLSYILTGVAYICITMTLCSRLKMKQKRCLSSLKVSARYRWQELAVQQKLPSPISTAQLSNVIVTETERSSFHTNDSSKTPTDTNKAKTSAASGLLQEQRQINRTTIIMFLITSINIVSVVCAYVGNSLARSSLNVPGYLQVIGYIIRTSYLVTFIANPLLYIIMSSRFRERMKRLLYRLRHCYR